MRALDHRRWLYAGGAAIAVLVAAGVVLMTSMSATKDVQIARALTGGEAGRAVPLLRRYGCAGCHEIPGVPGADGRVGPPLGQFRQRVFIAGVLPNDAGNLVRWLVDPTAIHLRSAMPQTGISESEARDVAAYLYSN
jgi:cytochrome c